VRGKREHLALAIPFYVLPFCALWLSCGLETMHNQNTIDISILCCSGSGFYEHWHKRLSWSQVNWNIYAQDRKRRYFDTST